MVLEKSWYEYYITKFVGIPYNHVIILYFSNIATLIIKKLKPYLASPNEFSPADINTFCGKINHPNSEYTTPTKPKTPWLTSLSMKKGMQKSLERDKTQNSPTPISNQMGVDTEFPLKPGWALKENQKMGNLNPKDRYTAEKMHESLKELAHENELSVEDVLEVKTIKG
ncbi:unnamed protein product [Rhizophagus irregularis]|nr:unnamed protein product [Rhizophagus irregularis]